MRVRAWFGRMWRWRRWGYLAFVLVSVARIPARTGFRLHALACDTRLSWNNLGLSLTKVPHIVLFALFCLLTALQFDRVDRKTLTWSVLATLGMGLLVEIEEGATRTGNCRLTDVAPDALGALVVVALLMTVTVLRRGRRGAPTESAK